MCYDYDVMVVVVVVVDMIIKMLRVKMVVVKLL
jgi:hypothetical protein